MFQEMSDNQRRVYLDAVQLYEAFISAFQKSRSYRGGMHWKKSKGRQYLFKTRDRYGYGESLGPRSAETEKILADFQKAKKEAKNRLATLKNRLKEQSRFCKAAMIQRVPRIVTGVLRVLDQRNLLGQNILVIGTNAMYAYEAAAGLFLDRPLTATRDIEILWDVRPKLTLFADDETDSMDLLDVLRKADKSFEPVAPGSFRAVNRDGYMVDLIKPESTTTRIVGGLGFTATGGKRQGREVPQSLRVEPGAKHPVWKNPIKIFGQPGSCANGWTRRLESC